MIDKYSQEANNLALAADIAIEAFKKFPPHGWDERTVLEVVGTYTEFKNAALYPEDRFRNMRSLKYEIENVFTIFQEGSGAHVEEFWKKIKEAGLPYKRKNRLAKILKRKKIKDIIEYDLIIDVFLPYQEEKIITEEDVVILNQMILEFENIKQKR